MDHNTALHWAAAAGHVDVVRRLLDAGFDPIGAGDDHELGAIGWASCWEGTPREAQRAIVNLLLERGARHHIFSAIAMNRADEVRRIVAEDRSALERPMSWDADVTPLHLAVLGNHLESARVLLEAGANPKLKDSKHDSDAIGWAEFFNRPEIIDTLRS